MKTLNKHLRIFGPYWAIFLISVLYVLVNWNPFFTLYGWADVDDTLQYNLSRSLDEGEWLGEYNRATLIKGIGFPVWTAALHNLDIPLWVGTSVMTILAGIAVIYALRRIVKSRWLLVAIYALIVLNPLVTDRVYRDYTIPFLTLFICAWAMGMFITIIKARTNVKITIRDIVVFTVIGALALPAWYITREDSYWILPLVLGLIGIGLFSYLRQVKWKVRKHAGFLIGVSVAIFLPFALVYISDAQIANKNEATYGRQVVNDYFSTDFKDAYASLTRVENTGKSYLTVPVTNEMRSDLYASVPAFKELKSCLDADDGMGGCEGFKKNGVNLQEINDYQGGWLPFAIRLAVENKGYYASPSIASEYYTRLKEEVDIACRSGELVCHEARSISLLPTPNAAILTALFTSKDSSIWSMLFYMQRLDRDDNLINTYKTTNIPRSEYLDEMAGYYDIRYHKPPTIGFLGMARMNIADTLMFLYRIVNPILLYGSVFVTALATFLHLRRKIKVDWRLLAVAWLLMLTIGLRLSMLAYLYTVHFPSTANVYFAATYSLLFLFEGVGIVLAVSVIRELRKKRKS